MGTIANGRYLLFDLKFMATITLGGNPTETNGELPKVGTTAPDFKLAATDLTQISLEDYKGKRIVMNIFPSVDTGVCAASVRQFNKEASTLEDIAVLCISRDLPFAQARFCGAEGLDNVTTLSDFKDGSFGKEYGLEIADGAFAGLCCACDANMRSPFKASAVDAGKRPS